MCLFIPYTYSKIVILLSIFKIFFVIDVNLSVNKSICMIDTL